MKRDNEQTLSEAIKLMLENYRLSNKFNEAKARGLWEEVMGHSIAQFTNKVEVRKGVMYVYLQSAELRNELSYGRQKIVQMINKEMGEDYLSDIKLM